MNNDLKAEINSVRQILVERMAELSDKATVLKAIELKALYERIPSIDPKLKAEFGAAVNSLKVELTKLAQVANDEQKTLPKIDISSPFGFNVAVDKRPQLLPSQLGSIHPITKELNEIINIFTSMGFSTIESREIDDDWHMFGSLNFPEGHPARDDYDTFMTNQLSLDKKPWIAPAHTSTMQNRALIAGKVSLGSNQPIAVVIPGRVFRNEDVDARHEHTFYQIEGVFVDSKVSIGNLISTLKTFLESYYQKSIEVRTQPFYFPFTEPSLEFSISCPFCDSKGCRICSFAGWIELIGCGMIHPNVLKAADIDPLSYQGFAFGIGIERLVMMKHGIEDIRLFESGRLDFLRQFAPEGGEL